VSTADLDRLFGLGGKTALVTGGTRGIGMMIARGLLQAGASVVLSSRKADACERAVAALSGFGPVRAVPADLSRQPEWRCQMVCVGPGTGRISRHDDRCGIERGVGGCGLHGGDG
jgi:NAD(P)-dependent dehydrogenase (short-subunit alcohol dehydrogenase family)